MARWMLALALVMVPGWAMAQCTSWTGTQFVQTPGCNLSVQDMNTALTYARTQALANALTAVAAGASNGQALGGVRVNVAGDAGLSIMPVGNAYPTKSSVSITANALNTTDREFMVSIGMTSATGASCTGPQCARVSLYTAMDQQAGSTDAWAQNVLVRAGAGSAHYLQAIEVDVDNARGDTPVSTANWIGGITLTGTNTNPAYVNRHALMVSSGQNRALWHAGLLGVDSSVKDALIYDQAGGGTYSYWNQSAHSGAFLFDQGVSPVSVALSGTYSRAGVSTENATTPHALLAADGQDVCFNGTNACVSHASGNLVYIVGGVRLFSVSDTTGNVVFKGTVTPSGTP